MMFLGILLALTLVPMVLAFKFKDSWGTPNLGGLLLSIICSIIFLIALLALPLNRMEVSSRINEIDAIRNTSRGTNLDSATWRKTAAGINAEIASYKYYNHTTFDIYIPDEVDTLKPIE